MTGPREPRPPSSRVPSPEVINRRQQRWESEHYEHWHSEESGWGEARKQAKQRDGGRCVICGKTERGQRESQDWGAGLHVHHIKPAAAHDTPEEAHTLGNLATLCAQCHRQAELGDISDRELEMAIGGG